MNNPSSPSSTASQALFSEFNVSQKKGGEEKTSFQVLNLSEYRAQKILPTSQTRSPSSVPRDSHGVKFGLDDVTSSENPFSSISTNVESKLNLLMLGDPSSSQMMLNSALDTSSLHYQASSQASSQPTSPSSLVPCLPLSSSQASHFLPNQMGQFTRGGLRIRAPQQYPQHHEEYASQTKDSLSPISPITEDSSIPPTSLEFIYHEGPMGMKRKASTINKVYISKDQIPEE